MKHKIVTAICLVAVFALGILSVNVYHSRQFQANLVAARTRSVQVVHDRLQKEAVAKEQRRLDEECKKSEASYSLLTAKQKTTVAVPNCHLQIVQ